MRGCGLDGCFEVLVDDKHLHAVRWEGEAWRFWSWVFIVACEIMKTVILESMEMTY